MQKQAKKQDEDHHAAAGFSISLKFGLRLAFTAVFFPWRF